ncbi:MAG TPA: hypothetical protein VEY92_10025 [Pseudoxanthomonas sp.]|nr:hypothetical protein [Pseudoxanthomonas sp.]
MVLLRSGNSLIDKPVETDKTCYYYAVSADIAAAESALSQLATIPH